MNFFQRYRAKQPQEIEPPAVTPPVLPNEEVAKEIDAFKPIRVDDAQYALLTRALRPGIVPVREPQQADAPSPNVPAVAEQASEPPAATPGVTPTDHALGTPIV